MALFACAGCGLFEAAHFARVFVFGLGETLETEQVKGKKVQRVKVGGWSQARYQRRVQNAQQKHAKEVVEVLERTVREDPIGHIVLAGDAQMLGKLMEEMPKALAEKAVGTLKMDLSTARGLACVGTQDTLEALANGRVDELLLSASLEQTHPEETPVEAVLAPEIPDSTGLTASDEPRQALLPDLLVTKARQTDAAIRFIQGAGLLAGVEGVGAFLRWR